MSYYYYHYDRYCYCVNKEHGLGIRFGRIDGEDSWKKVYYEDGMLLEEEISSEAAEEQADSIQHLMNRAAERWARGSDNQKKQLAGNDSVEVFVQDALKTEKIADNLNMDFGSVDFMFDGNDYYFSEANSCIGMKSHFILNFNITEKLIEFFEQNYKDLV